MKSRGSQPAGTRKHAMTERMKRFAADVLAQKIGYLRLDDFADPRPFAPLPTRQYGGGKTIAVNDELLLIRAGSVDIHHPGYGRLVKELGEGVLFGELALIGQSLIGTRAQAGRRGATLAVMDVEAARAWIRADPVALFERLGTRLQEVDGEHFRSRFQLADSRVARALLRLSGDGTVVTGLSHGDLGLQVGLYRETVTSVLSAMRRQRLVATAHKRVTLLNKPALRALSEL